MTTLRAKESFTAYVEGKKGEPRQPVTVAAGELLDSTHPTVKGREKLFESVEDHVANPGRWSSVAKNEKRGGSDVLMERATADPDERRSVRPRPAKAEVEEKDTKLTPTRGLRTGDVKGKQDGEV